MRYFFLAENYSWPLFAKGGKILSLIKYKNLFRTGSLPHMVIRRFIVMVNARSRCIRI